MANDSNNKMPVEAVVNKIICDGKLKASILFNDKHIVEIIENELVHYKKPGSKEWSLLKRGRLAQQQVKMSEKYTSYSCISYIELESVEDELEILKLALKPLFEQTH